MADPIPSQRVRDLVFEGRKMEAMNVYGREAKVKQGVARRVVKALAAGDLGPLVDHDRTVIVHRHKATRRAMSRWLASDIDGMAQEGYAEVSHHEEGMARGCAAFFAPPMSEMVVTYRREGD